MLNCEFGTLRPRAIGLALALLALPLAAPAGAQLVFDGNVLWNNNPSGTLVGQFSGVGTATCAYPPRADTLGTTRNIHNTYQNPLLPTAVYTPGVVPVWQPQAGSPAFTEPVVRLPDDGFFTQVAYHGAIGPNPGDDWTLGWTNYDSTGCNRQDLHLSGMPDPRPLATYRNVNLYVSRTWAADSNYLVGGQLRIKAQANLTIPAGTVVFGERATLGTIVVERGGHITAVGTKDAPIIMTSDDPPCSQVQGAWGGLVVNGYGRTNVVNSCAGDSVASEGGAIGYWGGDDNTWDACDLRYVRIEYSGKEIVPNNELNSFTLNGCGSNSHMDYCEAFNGADDSFEWFGGRMDCTHLIGVDSHDDGIDTQLGTQLRVQWAIMRQSPNYTPAGTQNGDKGTEQDNNEYDYDATQCTGYTNTQLANVTFIGDKRVGAAFPGPTSGVNWRRGTTGTFLNGIITNFKTAALKIDDNATWAHHCASLPEPSQTVDVPITAGRVFVAGSAPNPFRNRLQVTFTLPEAGPVRVEVYGADGRLVQTLADETMAAGPHSIAWTVDRALPSGMYFYRVLAPGRQATGKVARVN